MVFITIITYHALQKLYLTRSGSKLREFLRAGLNRVSNYNHENKVAHLEEDIPPLQNVTYTVIELSELLRDKQD